MNILSISNSFGVDAHTYLHDVARAQGDDLTVVTLYIGGCTLDRHYRNMLGDQKAYELYFNGYGTGFKVSMEEALLSRSWDVVTLQQGSRASFNEDAYEPYACALAEYVRRCAPKAKLVVYQTWAYEQDSDRLRNVAGYEQAEDMFRDIEKAYKRCADMIRADGMIPGGKLMQDLLANGIPKIHRDTLHVTRGTGRYALSLLWYRMLTGKSVMENSFNGFHESVTDEDIVIVKKCVEAFAPAFPNGI